MKKSSIRRPIVRGLHWGAHLILPLAGYEFELRRRGELKLGIWRKRLRNEHTEKTHGKEREKRKGSFKAASSSKSSTVPLPARDKSRFVVIPGFGDTPLSWLPIVSMMMPLLRKKYDEVILLDFPGFQGKLSRERGFHSMDLLMDQLFDVLDSLRPTTILGHSLGGWLTARYTGLCGAGERPKPAGSVEPGRKRSQRYSGPSQVILADPSGAFGNDSIRSAWEQLFQKVMEEGFHHLRPHVFGREPFWFRFVASELASFTSNEDIQSFMRSVRDEHFVEDQLSQIRAKVWLLWGENDTLTPASCASGWLKCFAPEARAQAVLIKGLGHSPQLEGPMLTAAVLLQMLSDRSPGFLGHKIARRLWEMPE